MAEPLNRDQLEGVCARLERRLQENLDEQRQGFGTFIFSDPAPHGADWRDRMRRRIARLKAEIEACGD